MPRHSFIQMSKLPNVKGRISYITSHARQENLYATYRTADSQFWSNLARESQQEFQRSGTEGGHAFHTVPPAELLCKVREYLLRLVLRIDFG